MPQRFWFTRSRAVFLPKTITSGTQYVASPSFLSVRSSLFASRLALVRPNIGASINAALQAAGTSRDILMWQGISPPLAADTAISGTIKGMFWGFEANTSVDAFPQLVARVLSNDCSTVRGTLLARFTGTVVELNASTTVVGARRWPNSRAVTTVNALAGDRICLDLGITTGAGAGNVAIAFGWLDQDMPEGDAATATVASMSSTAAQGWVELSSDLSFTAEPINPAWLPTGTVASGSSGGSPPAIANISPPNLSVIGTTDPITFDLVLLKGIRRTLVAMTYPDEAVSLDPNAVRTSEFVHDGSDFHPLYKGSTMVPITDGVRYTLRRALPWPSRPSPQIFAFDQVGQEL